MEEGFVGVQDSDYELVCGLEIHIQLKTKTKLFCSCPRDSGGIPNSNICPICVGLPGVLPALNKNALVLAVRASLLLNMQINKKSYFERKNYFYPDLPKNYQISQYRIPLAQNGYLEINGGKKIRIQRLHIEEDAGKMIHLENISLVDFSRSGVPLIEIVTYPDISSPEEAYEFLTKLHKIMVWCDVTEGNMEEGHLRCDVNVSVKPKNSPTLGTKVEIKNVNSFRFIKEAIEYEMRRQIGIIKDGGKIVQETRGYDPIAKKTFQMRTKEYAHDYRYFPEPDLLPIVVDDEIIENARKGIYELPEEKRRKMIEKYKISEYSADVLSSERELAEFFEELADKVENANLLASFILEEVMRCQNEGLINIKNPEDREKVKKYVYEVIKAQEKGIITRNSAKEAFREAISQNIDIAESIEKRKVESEEDKIIKAIDDVMKENPKEVERFKKGEKKLIGFFIGEVMKKIEKKGDPKIIKELLEKKLQE